MYRTAYLINFFGVLLLGMISCSKKPNEISLPFYNTPEFSPRFFKDTADAYHAVTHRIGTFSFANQWGKSITNKNIEGKIHVANFIFTRCGSICPIMTRHMKLVEKAFKDDEEIMLLSYSVT